MGCDQKIGIGLVGAGFMCRSHSNAYRKIQWNFHGEGYKPELIGVGDICQESADIAADRFGYSYGCVGWQQLLDDKRIALIDICVGDSLHKQVAIEALNAGKAVLCEKPLALNLADANEMEKAALDSGLVNMCGFNYRFFPAVILAKRLIDQGLLGTLYNFDGKYCQDQGADDRTPAEKLWYVQGSKASGASNGIGSHLVDMSRFFMGEVTSVSGLIKTYNPKRRSSTGCVEVTTDEEMLSIIEFKSGATGLYKASAVSAGRKNYFAFEIYGSRGSLSFHTEEPNILNVYLQDSPIPEIHGFTSVNVTQVDFNHPLISHFWPRGSGLGWEDAHVCELAHLLKCVTNEVPVTPEGADFSDGAQVVHILETIRESQKQKKHLLIATR